VDLWLVIAGGPYCPKRHLLVPWHGGHMRASTREVRVGSLWSILAPSPHVRFADVSGHAGSRPRAPVMELRRSISIAHSITLSARAYVVTQACGNVTASIRLPSGSITKAA
jgi:hypothetical protein